MWVGATGYVRDSLQPVTTSAEKGTGESVTKQRLVKTAEWESLARAVVIYKVYKSARLLELIVVTSYKISANPVINRNRLTI
jgi:hypothetical protein